MSKIKFNRIIRQCPYNEAQAKQAQPDYIFDFQVIIDGEVRAVWKRRAIGRRYELCVSLDGYFEQLKVVEHAGRPDAYTYNIEATSQKVFQDVTEKALAAGVIPTVAELKARAAAAADRVAKLEAEQSDLKKRKQAEKRMADAAPHLLRACKNIANEIEHWKHEATPTREMRQGCIDELRAAAALAEDLTIPLPEDTLVTAAKHAIEAMKNMRQGTFQGAVQQLCRALTEKGIQ